MLLGVSREWVSKLENGKEPFSEFVKLKLTEIVNPRETSLHVAEPQATYGQKPKPTSEGATEATEQQCIAHLSDYLTRARHQTGGIGYTYRLLQKHLPLEEFPAVKTPKKKTEPKFSYVTLPSQTQALSTETGKPIARPATGDRSA